MSDTLEQARNVPKGKVALQYCSDCTFIQNNGYDQNKVSFDTYDFSNDYSPVFNQFVRKNVTRLINSYNIRSKQILEVASGDGNFLRQFCKLGNNHGIGFDPGFNHKKNTEETLDLEFYREYYTTKHHQYKPDLLICRHLLNLLDSSKQLLQTIRKNLNGSEHTLVYIEVPNADHTFKNQIYWNVGYEHGVWFTCDTLQKMMEDCDFKVLEVYPCWNDEFIGLVASPFQNKSRKNTRSTQVKMKQVVSHFSNGFERLLQKEKYRLQSKEFINKKIVAWGAGARAVTYFNVLQTNGIIKYIVDINRNRHNKYLPGSGTRIVEPEFLKSYKPDVVMITNPTYSIEIKSHIASMGLSPQIVEI